MAPAITETVHSRTFRLIKPRIVEEQLIERQVPEGFVVVEPTLASICHADLRYYGGLRKPEVLAKKLPMALLHEGIGVIVHGNAQLQEGQRVAIVPYQPGYARNAVPKEECCPACRGDIEDNYCSHAAFLGSGTDGIAQQRLVLPECCAIPILDDIPDEIAVLAELCSVSYRAMRKVRHLLPDSRVAVFGDGPVGYLTAAMIRHAFHVDGDRLIVFGADQDKLDHFKFAHTEMVQGYDFASAGHMVDIVVECTGGKFSESAINQGIDILKPGGCLVAMGVSEERVPVNTRDILEKGITVYGSSRSSDRDFREVLKVMAQPECQDTLRRLLPESYKVVSHADDFAGAMESALAHRDWHKTILDFHW